VDRYVKAFEAAWTDAGRATVESFVPPADDPAHAAAVRELVRVDLEFGWDCGRPRNVDDYRQAFPGVFADPAALAAVAFEEYRQRREHGQDPDPVEYADRYGIDVSGWPPSLAASSAEAGCERTRVVDVATNGRAARPAAADPAADLPPLPAVGEEFLGFHLEAELGRGAFGQVFLARQGELADRLVALKVSADLTGESQTLAQLQHTNIVPINSIHRSGAVQAVCMPYYGGTTLVDVIQGLRRSQALPASGKHLVSTVNDRKHSTVRPGSSRIPASGVALAPRVPASVKDQSGELGALTQPRSPAELPRTVLDRYAGQSYVEAVLWIGGRLADGLAYAHEKGIVHRDLKPANVLLTDDGTPMLLDFNLADDPLLRERGAASRIGGTLPYMSPEQLAAVGTPGGRGPTVDARTDVYSLGLVLFELLTGQPAYMARTGSMFTAVPAMLADRRQSPPRLTPHNPDITPAAEAIVRKCLEPDPAHRYQSARALQEDIDRHLEHKPLRHQPEPSVRERSRKWVRRHPRLTSATTVAAVAVVAVTAAAAGAAYYRWESTRLAAAAGLTRLAEARVTQQALLNRLLNAPDRESVDRAADLARGALADYGVLSNPNWRDGRLVTALPPDGRRALADHVAGLLLTWAEAELRRADGETGDARRDTLTRAWQLTDRAEACLSDAEQSLSLWRVRALLAGALGRDDHKALAEKAAELAPRTADDHFALGRALMRQYEFRDAIPHLLAATRLDPKHFWAWHNLGTCYHETARPLEAIACFGACLGLSPDPAVAYFPHYHRALVLYATGQYAAAEVDVARAVECLPALPASLRQTESPKPYLLRADILKARKDYAAAEAVLTEVLTDGGSAPLYLERARVRELRKDTAGARRDYEAVVALEAKSEADWTDRGLAHLELGDPKAALADFDRALAIDPDCRRALQNKAHVLSEHLARPAEALAVLDRLVRRYPGSTIARIGRGVLLARQGKRAEAHAEVLASLARDHEPMTLYQAANVYALTSRQEPRDAERVLPLLATALWSDEALREVDADPDMAPVRGQAWFKQTVAVIRALKKESAQRDRPPAPAP
jgi:serine/threonine protein kinase/tetratricopeptide (TPR) repeat protein